MADRKQYDDEFKVQALKLAKEITVPKAAKELNISKNTLYGWAKAARDAKIDLGAGSRSPEDSLSLVEEIKKLRAENKAKDKEIKRLKEMNDFLEEASAFFAASRQRSRKASE